MEAEERGTAREQLLPLSLCLPTPYPSCRVVRGAGAGCAFPGQCPALVGHNNRCGNHRRNGAAIFQASLAETKGKSFTVQGLEGGSPCTAKRWG